MKQLLDGRVGRFSGRNQLWLEGPRAEPSESNAEVELEALLPGRLLRCSLKWRHEETHHLGALLLAWDRRADRVTGAWIDSFHQSGHVMHLEGTLAADGSVSLEGRYPAPPGPDWGWRIRLRSGSVDSLEIEIDNVDPEGNAELAVAISLART